MWKTGNEYPHDVKDCHRARKDNSYKGNGSNRYDQMAARQSYYPPPPAAPIKGAENEYKQPNRVVALLVNHKTAKAAEPYIPDKYMYDTKPFPAHKMAEKTYTALPTLDEPYMNTVNTKTADETDTASPYTPKLKRTHTKFPKSDVIDLTEVNVNDTNEIIYPKKETFDVTLAMNIDELGDEFNMEAQLRNLDKSVKEVAAQIDTLQATLSHAGVSNTHQVNATNSTYGVVNAMSKVVAKAYKQGEETHQHLLTLTATVNAARRENN